MAGSYRHLVNDQGLRGTVAPDWRWNSGTDYTSRTETGR